MLTKRILGLAVALSTAFGSLAVLPVAAQNLDVVKERQALMKKNAADSKLAAQMIKGDVPFDSAKAKTIFSDMHDVAVRFGGLFPEDSKTGGGTEASPAIWQKPDEFKAALAKFSSDTNTAMEAAPQDLDSFKQQFGAVAQNCKSCHQQFRQRNG